MIYIVCSLIVAIIYCGDMWVKNRVEQRMGEEEKECPKGREEPCHILGGCILLRKHHNKGAVLNWGQNRRGLMAALSVVLCVAMSVVFALSFGQKGNHLLRVGLAFLLGGAFSNTYDRLKRQYVVDYFSFNVKWKRLRNVVFNLSDICIMLGAALMVIGTV